jgi:Flp pilus assembly protein TadD
MHLRLTNYLAIVLCLVLSAVQTVTCAASNPLLQAKTQIQHQHYNSALNLLDQFLQDHPKDLDARFMQGVVLSKLNKTDAAINVFELLTRQYPHKPEPFNNLAVLYAKQGKFDKARDVLLQAIRTHHSYATAYENLGSIYAKMAINAYTSALDLKKQQVASDIKLAMLDDITPAGTPIVANSVPDRQATGKIAALEKPLQVVQKPALAPANAHQVQVEQQILRTLLSWSKAWSNKNTENYLAYYADEFTPPHGMSRKAWENQRRQRIRKPSFIKVTINSPEIKLLNKSSAELKFSQKYRSDSFRDQVKKVILMKKIDGKWQIVRENAAG